VSEYRRGNDTSEALTEVRTVLRRAETALVQLEREQQQEGTPAPPWLIQSQERYGRDGRVDDDGCWAADPDLPDMLDALSETVRRLDKYRRTGKTKRR
jgi:hypothetical protein